MVVVRCAGIARIGSIDEFVESCEDLCGLEGGHVEEAAPDLGGGKAAKLEARDNPEVVRAALEGTPQVRIG